MRLPSNCIKVGSLGAESWLCWNKPVIHVHNIYSWLYYIIISGKLLYFIYTVNHSVLWQLWHFWPPPILWKGIMKCVLFSYIKQTFTLNIVSYCPAFPPSLSHNWNIISFFYFVLPSVTFHISHTGENYVCVPLPDSACVQMCHRAFSPKWA